MRAALLALVLVLSAFHPAAAGMVTLTFDDGLAGVYAHAYPVLRRLGLPGVAAVIVERLESGDPDYMRPEQVRELQDAGWEIASHSLTHRRVVDIPARYDQEPLAGWRPDPAGPGMVQAYYPLQDLAGVLEGGAALKAVSSLGEAAASPGTYYYDRIIHELHVHPLAPGEAGSLSLRTVSYEREMEESRRRLRELGFAVSTYVIPYNYLNDDVAALGRKHYSALVTGYDGDAIVQEAEPYHVFRTVVSARDTAERFIRLVEERVQGKDAWLVLCMHDIESGRGWEPWPAREFEKLATWLKERGVPVVTVREGVARMQRIKARE
ncbi:MAG: polysaccharide deacetylase family protein [Thermodesulfobacteriota bacterium]